MSDKRTEHDEKHQESVRLLIERRLAGDQLQSTERRLLTCEQCLAEYNRYRNLWQLMANRAYFDQLETRLREAYPEKYRLYGKVIDALSVRPAAAGAFRPPAPWGAWFLIPAWRNLALALASVLVVIMPVAVYKWGMLQKQVRNDQAAYQTLLSENEKKEQRILQETQSAQALGKKVMELADQNRGQAEMIQGLREALKTYREPSANSILSVPFLATREPEAVQEIALPKDKLFLSFQIRASGAKEYKPYSLAITDHRGKVLWQADGVRKDRFGNFDLLIEKHFLPPGDYVLRIYGRERGLRDLISQIRFRIINRK